MGTPSAVGSGSSALLAAENSVVDTLRVAPYAVELLVGPTATTDLHSSSFLGLLSILSLLRSLITKEGMEFLWWKT